MKLTKDTVIAFIVAFILGFMVFNGEKQAFDDSVTKSAGKFMPLNGDENPLNGNAYALGSDDYMDKAMAFVDAYVDLDKEKVQSMLSEQMQPFADQMDKNESYSWKPWSMIPLKTIDGNGSFVISMSYDESKQKNGSKYAADYIDVLFFNDEDEGKVSGIWSTFRVNEENSEYGLSEGGKFFGRGESEYAGSPLVFSNRGEVDTLEKMFADYNNMDGEAVAGYFADTWTFKQAVGGTSEMTSEAMKSAFDNLESVSWTPFSMVPLKIKDTDPASGVTVYSTEKRVSKDGTVWEKDLVELFYFDLDGKISGIEQYSRDLE